MHENYIITNVNGIAMDDADTRFSALAVENGRITLVGSADDVAPLIRDGHPVLSLDGKTMLPGFMDTHQHLGLTGQVLNGLNFLGDDSLDTVYARLTEAAKEAPDDRWVLGYSLNEYNVREGRLPLKEDLDAACPNRPVMVVHTSWHLCALNSRALEILDLPRGLPGLDVGADGMPTGLVRDPGSLTHVFPAVSSLTPAEAKLASFRAACEAALRQGITTLHCLEGGEFGPGDTRLVVENRDKLPLNTVIWNQVMDIEETVNLGLKRIGGCICADGAIDARTAAVFEPYLDQPDNRGTLNFSQQQMDDFILAAHKAGLQTAIHCETDRAIEQVLLAMERAIAAHPRKDHRHRIEHCEIPTPGQLDRMAEAGIIASMQPAFFPFLVDMDDYELRFGKDRLRWIHPYRTMLDKGIVMCGGSDCPITPHTPLVGIQAAVLHPIKEERLTPLEAIRMFTSDAAYSGFEEHERGSIEPGKVADLVVLDDDPTTVAPEKIGSIHVDRVIVAGRTVER
ncbi:amidohydrolase family protein [Pseudodesulfovibrio cashew]|uniref:Amidohydrolase family protein n=1 Tax=Pseudodesulfovibrio cashew TaxID=2678688 RepID=A0A6I6JG37_9BACT|nr:amidohydrolase [Pseudodesulfovibrio cashew]QGY41806.1 amidohydrolase family protein [Pseudodesulfovibrio cashew]